MKKYLVGGAVRDLLLGRKSKDLDYVVFNVTEEELLSQGFLKISKNFPVFNHPDFKDCQYALPRKDIKVGKGYNGFKVETNNVSLHEDLERRDFTINAMALDEETNVILDPFNGKLDLQNKVIRHVGEHFAEDPLRVLRAARFKARYNFSIHESTQKLIDEMMVMNMLKEIPSSRFLQEFKTTEKEGNLFQFVLSLHEMNVLQYVFSSFDYDVLVNNLQFLTKEMSLNEMLTILCFNQNLRDIKGNSIIKALSNYEFNLVSSLNYYAENIINYHQLSEVEKIVLYGSGLAHNRLSEYRHVNLRNEYSNILMEKNVQNFKEYLKVIWMYLIIKCKLDKTFLRNNWFEYFNHVYKLLKSMNKINNDSMKNYILKDWMLLSKVNLNSVEGSSNPKDTRFSLLTKVLQKTNNWK